MNLSQIPATLDYVTFGSPQRRLTVADRKVPGAPALANDYRQRAG